jgi:hypothetical protein
VGRGVVEGPLVVVVVVVGFIVVVVNGISMHGNKVSQP